MTWTPPEVAQSMKSSVQDSGWVPPEVKKKEEPVFFGGSESLASHSAATEDKQPLTYMQQQLREKGLVVDETKKYSPEDINWFKDVQSNPRLLDVGNYGEIQKYKDITSFMQKEREKEKGSLTSLDEVKTKLDASLSFVKENANKQKIETFKRLYPNEIPEKQDDLTSLLDIQGKIVQSEAANDPKYSTFKNMADDMDSQAASSILNSLEESVAKIDRAKKDGVLKNIGKGVKEGVGDYFSDYINLSSTIRDNKAVASLNDKFKRMQEGSGEELTKGEASLFQALNTAYQSASTIDKEMPESAKIGEAIGGSLGFMLEFMGTGGVGAAAKAGVIKGAARLGATGAAAKATTGVMSALARAGAQTAAMPTLYKETAKKVSEGQTPAEAFGNAFYETAAEVGSEMLFMGKLPKGAKANTVVNKILERTGLATAGETGVKGISKGIGKEFIEEKFSETLTGLKDVAQDKQTFDEFANRFVNVEDNLRTLATVGIMNGMVGGVQEAGKAFAKSSLDTSVKMSASTLPSDVRSSVDDIVANPDLTPQEVTQLVSDVVKTSQEENKKELLVNAEKYAVHKLSQQAFVDASTPEEEIVEQTKNQEPVVVEEPTMSEEEDLRIKEFGRSVEEDQSKYVNKILSNKFEATNPFTEEKTIFNRKEDAAQYVFDLATKARTKNGRMELLQQKPTEAISEPVEPRSVEEQPIMSSEQKEGLKQQKEVVVYHSTYADFKDFKEGVNYFAEDPSYSKEIATTMNGNGKASGFVESRELKTIPAKINSDRIYELPKGEEMNSNLVDKLISDPEFVAKYDAIKGVDLYSKDKVVYAVLDKSKIEIQQQKQPLVGEQQIDNSQLNLKENGKESSEGRNEAQVRQQETLLVESKAKLEREVKKEENKARLGRIFDNAAKLTGARLDITSEEKRTIRKELARDVVDYVKTEFDLLGEALVEKVKSFVKDNNIPLEDISDQELNEVLTEKGYAGKVREQDKRDVGTQKGVVEGTEGKLSVGNDGKDQKTPRGKNEVTVPSVSTTHKPSKSETTKIGNFAVRVTLDESKVPQPVKDFFKDNEVGAYTSLSHDQAEGIANGIAAAHTYEELKAIVLEGKIHQTVRGALLVNIADIQDAEFQKAKKEGNEDAMEFWADESRNFLKEINDKVHDTALFLNYFGSARMMDRFEPYHHVREAQLSVEEEREQMQNGIGGKIHKKSRERAVKAAKKLRKDAVDGAINSPRAQAIVKENETKEPVFVKPDRLKELKQKEKSLIEKLKKAMRGGTLTSGGLNTEALEALGELAVVYLEEVGYHTGKAIKRLVNAAKQAGITLTEDQASKLIPTEIDGKKISDLQAEEAKQQAAEKLAQRIFGEVVSNKKAEDPLKQMVNTLLGKFKERDVKKEKKEAKSDIQKIADAIKNKDEYADVWAEANALAVEAVNENENLTEGQKQEAINQINEAYQNATSFTFTEAQIDRAIKKKMASLKIRVDQVVRDFYDLQSTERGRLKDALIEEAGLSEEQASKLASAIEDRFDVMMNEGKKKIIEKYIGRVKEKQDKIGQLDTKARKDAIAEFLELINIGAFDSKAFREAYATAVGLPVFTQAHADLIKSMAEEIKRQKTPEMKHKATQLLMATRQAMAGFSMSDVAQAAWYGNVLGNIKTQERNILGAWAGVMVNLGAEAAITGRPGAVIRGYAKSLKEAAAKAKDVMKTGYSPFAKTIDIPNTTEIIKGRGLFKYLLTYWRTVGRFMNSADLFNATTGKASFAEVLANENIVVNGVKGASRIKMLFSSKYRKQIAELVDRYLKVDKETVDRIKAEIEQDALEYGYTEQDKALILYGAIDRLRPTEVSEEAIKFGIFATGNVKAYGTLGFISDMLAKIFKNVIKIPVWYNKKTGKVTWIAPLSFIAAFTKIAGNVGTMSMNYVPGIGAYRILVGGYGAQFNLAEGKIMGLQKYAVELTEREKKSIWGRQIAGLASMTLLWLLSDPGDDDDPLIRVTANGTGDYTKNNAIKGEEWQEYSIGFKAPWGGRLWLSYKYTPLLLPFSMIGSARDAKKYVESEKEKSDFDLLLSGAWKAKSALADMTAVKSMNDFMTEFFSAKDADYNKMVKTMERTISGFYTPGIYRDAVDAIETISSISKAEEEGLKVKDPMKGVPEMNAKLMMERFAGNNPISVIKRIAEGGEYMDRRDVYGRKVDKIMPYSDVIKVTPESSEEDKMIFKHQSIMGNPSDPQIKQTFFILDNADGSYNKMILDQEDPSIYLNQADPIQNRLWHKYIIVRGKAIVEAIKENNYLDEEEYKEAMKTAIDDATEQARYEISYELNNSRLKDIKEWQIKKKK